MRVLLSIKPRFVEKIFDGTKKFEFRRSIFKRYASKVVVYASAPTSLVVGEFDIEEIICEDIDDLWKITKSHAGISKACFDAYFQGKKRGYAIKIGDVRIYNVPKSIWSEYGVQPPQSFLYLLDDKGK